MRRLITLLALLTLSGTALACPETLDFNKRTLAGEQEVNLCESYAGKVVLVVNTASKCAFTPQYEGLEELYRQYKDQGLVVLGFPSNDFGGQEPGTEQQIQNFCERTYDVGFPMFEKTHVRKGVADPLYETLARLSGDGFPQWNFHKYLIDREGRVVGSFDSWVKPQSRTIVAAIEKLL